MSSLSAAPSSSEFCSSKLLLASLEPPPMPSVSKSCPTCGRLRWLRRGSADPFCFEKWSKSKSKETLRGILLRKLAAQSETTPEEPSLDELEGFVTLVRREKSLQRRGKVPRWVLADCRSQQFLENVTALKNMFGTRCHHEEGRRLIVGFSCRRELFSTT